MTDRADPPVSAADLAENDSDEFVGALIDGASTPALTLLRILERRRYSAYAIAGRIAAHPSLRSLAIAGGDALLDLHPDDAIVLVRDEASPEVLTVLASYRTGAVREAVADCAATPPAALSILADDPLPNVRAFVASHPSTPADALERLANDSDPQVRAHSLGSTGEALAALATPTIGSSASQSPPTRARRPTCSHRSPTTPTAR